MSDEATQATTAVDPATGVEYGPVLAALAAAGIELSEGDDVLAITATTIGSLQERIGELETLNGVLTTEKTALEQKLAAADGAPKAEAAKAPKVRKVGDQVELPKNEKNEPLTPLELLELVRAAGKVEVAFSDGKRELTEIPARVISGDAWAITVAGLQLRGVDIELTGAGGAVEIVGYGLLLDGDLVAYRKRMDPLLISPGARVSLAGDIVF